MSGPGLSVKYTKNTRKRKERKLSKLVRMLIELTRNENLDATLRRVFCQVERLRLREREQASVSRDAVARHFRFRFSIKCEIATPGKSARQCVLIKLGQKVKVKVLIEFQASAEQA